MLIDKRLVLQFMDGQMTFRHINHNASYAQVLDLANALNGFQVDPVMQVLLVTVNEF